MKKKIFLVLCVVFIGLILLPVLAACTPREDILRISNWDDYIDATFLHDDEEVNGFKQYYKAITGRNITIKYTKFYENEAMLDQIERGRDYDVVCPSDYTFQKMMSANLVQPIMTEEEVNSAVSAYYTEKEEAVPEGLDAFVTENATVSPFIWEKVNELGFGGVDIKKYFAPYMWGTMGILYNYGKVVDKTDNDENGTPDYVQSWGALFNPSADYGAGAIYMKDSRRDSFAVASIYTFKDSIANNVNVQTVSDIMNVSGQEKVNKVLETLISQKGKTAFKGYESEDGKEELAVGDANAATFSLQWSGDAMYSKSIAGEGVDLRYYVPDEGSNVWFDGWCIPKYAENKLAATLWINYMMKPDVAIKNMEYIGYTSAIATEEIAEWLQETYEGEEEIALDYFFGYPMSAPADIDQYPSLEIINRCAVMKDYGDQQAIVDQAWKDLKAA